MRADLAFEKAAMAVDRCLQLARLSEESGRITRTFLSEPMRQVHVLVREWMEAVGMQVSIDAIGNIHGLRCGPHAAAPRLVIGSHLDTVPGAGAFDGVLGVTIAIGLAELVQEHSFQFDIEIIGFSEEEGVRFGVPFLGSRAVAGTLPASLLERCDGLGRTMADAIRTFGLDPSCLADVAQRPSSAYLEFHIEQGPVLDELNLPLGVVTAIAGQSRLEVTFKGETNHAGTTPMHLRHDTITGVAEWILQVERTAGADRDLVATVGSLVITPGAANVIAGETRATLDVRSAIDSKRTAAVDCILGSAREVASRRGLEVTSETRLYQPAVACDAGLQQMLARAVESAGYPVHKMVSGAGHDAMIMAHRMPMGMLFLRSPGGISHHSSETVRTEDVAAALQVGRHFVKAWRPDNA